MEIIMFSGGLGNQMFQYAFYLSKKRDKNKVIANLYSIEKENAHNGFELNRIFGIDVDKENMYLYPVKLIRKAILFKKKSLWKVFSKSFLWVMRKIGLNIIEEQKVGEYDQEYLLPSPKTAIYFGFWQSEKYFLSIQDQLKKIFSFNLQNISPETNYIIPKIQNENSVSLHIRRGDYCHQENVRLYGNICTLEYYEKAIDIIKEKVTNPSFYIFSDDIQWVKENLNLPHSVIIDWNTNENSWQDMLLMSQCKHNVIANSTFSWWGAWLNNNKNKIVIAPSRFINTHSTPDLIPNSWIKI